MKTYILGAIAAVALSMASTVQAQVVYDAAPTVGFTYGSGNDYTPANAVVLTTAGVGTATPSSELALRAHVPFEAATSTSGTGIYTFALGSDVSFDFSAFGAALMGATITVTNLTNNADASYLAALLGTTQASGALQGSQRLSFGFLNGGAGGPANDIDFDASQNNTFRIDLAGGGQTISAFAQIGSGAQVAAVPEPATWAMMLIGFGAVGVSLRRRRRGHDLLQAA